MVMITEIFDKKAIEDLKIGDQLPYDVVEDLKIYMTQDNDFYRKNLFPHMSIFSTYCANLYAYICINYCPWIC